MALGLALRAAAQTPLSSGANGTNISPTSWMRPLLTSRGIEHTLDALREALRHTEQHQQELEERQQGLAEQQPASEVT